MLTPERHFLLGVNFLSWRKAIMNSKTKRITVIGMLCAITYITMVVGRIPIILFLKYDPSDVIGKRQISRRIKRPPSQLHRQ